MKNLKNNMKNQFLYLLALIWIFAILVGISAFITYMLITEPIVRLYFGGILMLLVTIMAASYLANKR